MKRYLITDELRNGIRNSEHSMRKISREIGFQVKHVCNNISINENHLNKVKAFLKINPDLKEIKFDYAKNLGKYSTSKPIKKINKTKELAEFIGIMLGDGSFYRNAIKIAFDKRNENYIKYVEDLFEKIFEDKLKKQIIKTTNQAYLYYYNKNLVPILENLGLKRGDKIKNQVGIPDWIKESKEYSKRCIRGLIDTDGCIYRCKRERQIYVKFTNHNQQLLNDFKEITKNLGYSFAKANKTNTCLYRKDEVVNFIKAVKPLKSICGTVG